MKQPKDWEYFHPIIGPGGDWIRRRPPNMQHITPGMNAGAKENGFHMRVRVGWCCYQRVDGRYAATSLGKERERERQRERERENERAMRT